MHTFEDWHPVEKRCGKKRVLSESDAHKLSVSLAHMCTNLKQLRHISVYSIYTRASIKMVFS